MAVIDRAQTAAPRVRSAEMARTYIYVIDRDFGFAPNPFHGICTLATCKPDIRKGASNGDWVFGVGGGRLKATGRCILAMRVDGRMTFAEYWRDPEFLKKRAVRNGSRTMLVGDNIYEPTDQGYRQADSHHSFADGSPNPANVTTDTKADAVLISRHFYYFGRNAPEIPPPILTAMGYRNLRRHRVFEAPCADALIDWVEIYPLNHILGDPFDFDAAQARYSAETNRVTP